MPPRTFLDFATALFIGALVGIDREKKKSDTADPSFAGLRTCILLAEAGAVAAWLSVRTGNTGIFIAAALAVAAMLIAGHIQHTRAHPDSIGMTGEVAALVVYLLGGAVMFGERGPAVALGIATSAFLAFKEPLHAMLDKIDRDDIYAGIKLLVATFIVLPVLPNREVDPWGAFNPYKMWLLVILISGISLIGYIAVRILGNRHGTPLTGLIGGLASSTAVSLSFARRSRDERQPGAADALAAGILLAWTVMFIRIVAISIVICRPILRGILVPMSAMCLVCLLAAAVFYRRTSRPTTDEIATSVPLKNPFSLTSAVKFTLVFAIVLLAVKLMRHYAPGSGLYATAALAGLTDVDAITLSMADFARTGGPVPVAVAAITIAAVTNTLIKCAIALILGDRGLKWRIGVATALLLAAGAASLVWLR